MRKIERCIEILLGAFMGLEATVHEGAPQLIEVPGADC